MTLFGHALMSRGFTHAKMGWYKGLRCRRVERNPLKPVSVRSVATRPREVGVASNRRSATLPVNTFLALYTPPVTSRKSVTPEAGGPTPWGEPSRGGIGDWDEVVTR